jgi:flagellar motor switch protein FliN/FliY
MTNLWPSSTDAGEPPPAKKNGKSAESAAELGPPLIAPDSSLLKDVPVTLEARLGSVAMPVSELLDLRAGSVLNLDSRLNEPIELFLNNNLVARGEIVAVDDRFGVRIVEIAAR